jgi:hypothetical protein
MMRYLTIVLFASACFGQTSLTQYLGLTSAQQTAIRKLNSDYASYLDAQTRQLIGFSGQLAQLYAKESVDPAALGKLYVQSEMVQRDIASHLATLQAQTAAQLTGAQAGLIAALGDAIVLQPLAQDAACAFLAPQTQWFDSTAFNTNPYVASAKLGSVYSAILSPYPFVPPAPSGTFCGSPVFPISIREYLSVTNTQVAALASASAAYNDYYAKQQDQMNDLYVNIRDETAKPSPDPAVLGFFYSQLANLGKSIQQEQAGLQQQAQAALSDAQKTTLKKLQDTAALAPIAQQAGICNLLLPPPGTNAAIFLYGNCQL